MRQDLLDAWVAALESGDYQPTGESGVLSTVEGGFSPLAVLLEIAGASRSVTSDGTYRYWFESQEVGQEELLPIDFLYDCGLGFDDEWSVYQLGLSATHEEVAEWVRSNVDVTPG